MTLSLLLAASAAPAQGPSCPPEVVEAERIYSGVFVDDFESQQFFEGAKGVADIDRRARPRTWADFDVVGFGHPFDVTRREPGIAYHVRFVGVKRSRGVAGIPCGYGHMNSSDAAMRVVRLLAIERLGRSTIASKPS